MKKAIILGLIIGLHQIGMSQNLTVNFLFDSPNMDDLSKQSVINFININQPKSLVLKGFADTIGTNEYNKFLVDKRLKSVEQVIHSQSPDIMLNKVNNGEELSFSGSNHDNRKVELFLSGEVYRKKAPNYKRAQIFNIDNQKDTIIVCEEGTTIYIPANAFAVKNSGEKTSGNISFKVTEYYKIGDMIDANLTTQSGNEILETAGMLYLQAFKGDSECIISNGNQIGIHFNNISEADSMGLFSGDTINNGIDWKPINSDRLSKYKYTIGVRREDGSIYYPDKATQIYATDGSNSRAIIYGFLWTNQLNWINCDKYARTGNLIQIKINVKSEYENYYAVFNKDRSIIAADVYDRNKKTQLFRNIPSDKQVQIVGIKIEGNISYLSIFTVSKNVTIYDPVFKVVTKEELSKELNMMFDTSGSKK